MKILRAAIVILLITGLVVFFMSGDDEPADTTPTLNRAISTDIETIDPHKARSTQAGHVLRDIGEGLMSYTADGQLIGGAAESWSMSDDGTSYTFTLRPNLKWSNGDDLVAAHFVAGLQRLVNPDTAAFYAGSISAVKNAEAIIAGEKIPQTLGAEAPDDHTVVIHLTQPTPYFLRLLTQPNTYPAHPPSVTAADQAFTAPEKLVSNGAYQLVSWEPGSLIRLRKNEHYWNAANTSIERVNFHVVTEVMAELNRYRAGELHITAGIPPDAFAQMVEERPDEVRVSEFLGVYYYGYNLTRPPFSDNPKLRAALSMAVDREALVEKVLGRGEAAAYSWVPPGTHDYAPPKLPYAHMSADERVAAARRLYREAGYSEDNPLEVELRYNSSETQQRIALAIAGMWSDTLGVETTTINEEFQVLLANIREAEVTQVFRLSWMGDYDDAHTFLSILQSGDASNMPQYSSEEFDDLMERAAAQTDPKARRLYLEEAEHVLLRDHPVIPIYFYISEHLISPEVKGWQDNVLDYHYSHHLSLSAD